MANITNLKQLKLGMNSFTGSIPAGFSNFTKLQNLLLRDNLLTGPLPDFSNGKYLDLMSNQISGTLPASLFAIPGLKYLYLSNNKISGNIPINYGNSTSLRDLYLNDNNLSGSIPDVPIGSLPSISEILFDGNKLSGSVPGGLCDIRESFPKKFVSLHVDCMPPPESNIAQNPCKINCCTACFVGNGTTRRLGDTEQYYH